MKKMADLLIKGMEMPTMPETFKQAESVPYIDVRIFADGTAVTSKGERPFYTQYSAVPVPPHGRLIDADALIYQLAKQESVDRQPRAIRRAERIVANVPTVIEASEDGEQNG